MSERIQKTFTLSFNSKINSDLKMWEALQKLPKGYGKKLFQNLLEEKFGKSNSIDFELRMMRYLDLELDNVTVKNNVINSVENKIEVTTNIEIEKPNFKSSNDSLEV